MASPEDRTRRGATVAGGGRHTDYVSDYERAAADLAGAIRLGYETEREDPRFPFEMPHEDEIRWLGAWLASEGFSRPNNWTQPTNRPD